MAGGCDEFKTGLLFGLTKVCAAGLALRFSAEAIWIWPRLLMHGGRLRHHLIDFIPDLCLLDTHQHELGIIAILNVRILLSTADFISPKRCII